MTYTRLLRKLRRKAFDYTGAKDKQFDRVLLKVKEKALKEQKSIDITVGAYSGLTKLELQKTGTCETDWY